MEALILDMDDVVVYAAMDNAEKEHENTRKLINRKRNIVRHCHYLDVYSDQECLQDFRFKRKDIGIIASLVRFNRLTSKNA